MNDEQKDKHVIGYNDTKKDLGKYLSKNEVLELCDTNNPIQARNYVITPHDQKIKPKLELACKVANIMQEHHNKAVNEAFELFEQTLPEILKRYTKKKQEERKDKQRVKISKERVALLFLGYLSYHLNQKDVRISKAGLESVVLNLNFRIKIDCLRVAKAQLTLFDLKILKKKKKKKEEMKFANASHLRGKVNAVIVDLRQLHPQDEYILTMIKQDSFLIIENQVVPCVAVDYAAIIIIRTLLFLYYDPDSALNLWETIKELEKKDFPVIHITCNGYRERLHRENIKRNLGLMLPPMKVSTPKKKNKRRRVR